MAEEQDLILTQKTFNRFCEMLDENGYKYSKNDKFVINTGFNTDDLPVDMTILFDNKFELIVLISEMPFSVSKDKFFDMAYMLSLVNMSLPDGCFQYDMQSGKICFRITLNYMHSIISKKAMQYLLDMAYFTIDKFNDKMFMFLKDKMTFEEFAKFTLSKEEDGE